MIKKIIYSLLFMTLISFLIIKNNNIVANASAAKLYLVFDKMTYGTNEIVNLNINLDQFSKLSEIKLQIKIDLEYLEPIKEEEKYFTFLSSSICKNDIVNDFTIDNILRLRLLKDNSLIDGYYSSYKNNICNIKFKTKKSIDNIYSYFTIDNYNNMGISLYLFDTSDNLITYTCNYLEKMKINWDKDSYELEVYSEVPDFKEDIIVENRAFDEYEYLIEKTIDTSAIGLKTIHIAIYDKLTADYVILSKAINIVDNTAPVISMNNMYKINDYQIEQEDFYTYPIITDNYDIHLNVVALFYDVLLNQINNMEEFKKYLSSNKLGYIKYKTSDTSGNSCETEFIEIHILDTNPPIINKIEEININDFDINNLNLSDFFELNDVYDGNAYVVFDFLSYNILSFDEIKELLSTGEVIEFIYYGIDNNNNKTEELKCKINPIDTTSPTIEVTDILINDTDYNTINFNDYIKVTDNFNIPPTLITTYFIDDIEVLKEEFDKYLQKGKNGFIKYVAYDKYNNYSSEYVQNIKIVDTISPIIKVNNVKNLEKYISVEKIEYEISDNFDGCSVKVLLDDLVYGGEQISLGKHYLYIEAVDLSGNKTELGISFEIIEDNVIGCGNDFSCYINNYIEIVIIVGVLLLFVVGLIITHIIIKNKKEEIS